MPAEERFRPRLLRDQLGAALAVIFFCGILAQGAALAVIFFCGILAQGRGGSTSLMIPPRHRPYFENISSTVSGPYYHIHGGETKPKSLPFLPVSFVKKRTLFRRDAAAVTEEQSRQDPRCHQFSIGNPERNEFYSPYYPNPYPSKVDCVRILTAGPGELIKLDFRDQFDLEYHVNCSYDYLEVRDGGHGYNKRIGAYCGNTFPDMIYSSSRSLWLRFYSDDTIEGKGFAAVYEVIPSPTDYKEQDECNIPVSGYEGWVNSTDINQTILQKTNDQKTPIDCTWKIEVQEGWKVQLYFKKFDLDKPNDCEINFVDIFSPNTDMESRISVFCSSMADLVVSKNNVLYVRYFADWKARNSSFSALFTAFRDSKEGCNADEFDCQDTTCILKDLECNGNENCRFRWDDDEHCTPKTGTIMEILMADHIIIILVIFCLILSGMCFTFVFNCVRKLVHDHRIIQEHMRQSRASRLDQVGKSAGLVPSKSATSGRSRSNSSSGGVGGGSLSPHHLLRAVRSAVSGSDTRLDNESGTRTRGTAGPEECYVPGAGDLMPILIGANRSATVSTPTEARPVAPVVPANGDAVFLKDTHHTHDTTTSTDDDMVIREQQDQQPSFDVDDDDDMEMATFPAPEMRDNECQTRESLFMNTTSSERSMTPPPPPPPAVTAPGSRFNTGSTHHSGSHHRHHRPTPVPQMHGSTTSPFSTFGYTQHHQHQHRGDSSLSSSRTTGKDFATLPHHHHHHTHQHSTMSPEAAQRFRAEAVIEMEHKPHHHHVRDGSNTTTTTTTGGGGLDGSTMIPPPPAPPTTAIPPPPPLMGSLARPFSVESTKSAPDVIVTH